MAQPVVRRTWDPEVPGSIPAFDPIFLLTILKSREISHALPQVLTSFIISHFDFMTFHSVLLPALRDSDFNLPTFVTDPYVIPNRSRIQYCQLYFFRNP